MLEASITPAVEVINVTGASGYVLLCEHASNYVPVRYHDLSLTHEQLQRHIAWDVGAAAVTRRLSLLLDAPAFLGTYSRLLIDLNRPLEASDSIPTLSENVVINGNVGIDPIETERRIKNIFLPFHRAVSSHLDLRLADRRPTRLVSIHSYTPIFLGVPRPWYAGVLFAEAAGFGMEVLGRLQLPKERVGANVPYKTDRTGDYAIPIHGDDRGIPAIMIEIRNDLIETSKGVEDWAQRIAFAICPSAPDHLGRSNI